MNAVFNIISAITHPCIPGFRRASTLKTILFSSDWLLSKITIVETMDSGESEMNPVATANDNHYSSERISTD